MPVHAQNRPLLRMCWNEVVYVDTAPPFGLKFTPNLFSQPYADGCTVVGDVTEKVPNGYNGSYNT